MSSLLNMSFRYVAAQLTTLKEHNAQAAGWAKLQIENLLYNAQFPAPPPSGVHARLPPSSTLELQQTEEDRMTYLEASASSSSAFSPFNYSPSLL